MITAHGTHAGVSNNSGERAASLVGVPVSDSNGGCGRKRRCGGTGQGG